MGTYYYDTDTSNQSFINMWRTLQKEDISNITRYAELNFGIDDPAFILTLMNRDLVNHHNARSILKITGDDTVDYAKPVIESIVKEANDNFWYYFREICYTSIIKSRYKDVESFRDLNRCPFVLTEKAFILLYLLYTGQNIIVNREDMTDDVFNELLDIIVYYIYYKIYVKNNHKDVTMVHEFIGDTESENPWDYCRITRAVRFLSYEPGFIRLQHPSLSLKEAKYNFYNMNSIDYDALCNSDNTKREGIMYFNTRVRSSDDEAEARNLIYDNVIRTVAKRSMGSLKRCVIIVDGDNHESDLIPPLMKGKVSGEFKTVEQLNTLELLRQNVIYQCTTDISNIKQMMRKVNNGKETSSFFRII